MNTQVIIAILAIIAGGLTIAVPNSIRYSVGGWLVVAGILWLIR